MDVLAPVGPGPLHLLDLPTELLLEALRDVPWSVRATCRCFCKLVDGRRQALSLRPCPSSGPRQQLRHLTTLLHRLPSLTSLHVNTFEFKTLPTLSACPALASLTFADAPHLSSTALSSLKACVKLAVLDLSGCGPQLTSLSMLSTLTALRSLDVGEGCTHLTDVAPLQYCPHITSLKLGSGVTSLGPLTALHGLASLVSSNYVIHDFSPIASSAASLTHLRFNPTGTGDLSALSPCTQLVSMELDMARWVSSLDPLTVSGFALTRFYLSSSPVVDLRPLSSCTSLSNLALTNCWAITSIAALSSLGPSLTSLDLSYSPIRDASPLSLLTALSHLDLSWTRCTSVTPLAACTLLRKLRVGYTRIRADQLYRLQQAIPLLEVDNAI